MLEADRYNKNEFNPMLNDIVFANKLTNKKLQDPSRPRADAGKYQYVVDWQIEEDRKTNRKTENYLVF